MKRGCAKLSLVGCGSLIVLGVVGVLAGGLALSMLVGRPSGGALPPVTSVSGDCPQEEVRRYFGTAEARSEVVLGQLGHLEGEGDTSLAEALVVVDIERARADLERFVTEPVPECLAGYKSAEIEFYQAMISEVEALQEDVAAGAGSARVLRSMAWMLRNGPPHMERRESARARFEAEQGYDTRSMEALGLDW